MTTLTRLDEIERRALSAFNLGDYEQAIEGFSEIVKRQPDYEHGAAFYNLGCALEDSGRFEDAMQAYQMSIRYSPDNIIFLGAYASFLYGRGFIHEAIDAYAKLYAESKRQSHEQMMERSAVALRNMERNKWISESKLMELLLCK